ncbi:hypothetical protein [Streptomyces goshikiensis]|uniref:hypothetical protein n=1 Tax=Streptomyces goshikiensis TaxID=1942 RepID=UPI00332BD68C
MALAAPLVVAVAFLVDTGIKSVFREQRPCRTLHTVTPAETGWLPVSQQNMRSV